MGAEGGAAQKEKSSRAPMTIIGDAIHAETIKKELRTFRLNESFVLSPTAIKIHLKPAVAAHHPLEIPRTTASVYGWDTEPLVRITDRRFYHPKQVTEITKMYGTTLAPKTTAPEKTK
ncbi:hypothetical protein HDV03_000452 [Kappamyces sp. JEL0829]|nr:hypothetical protein HDV03_000452 [Kappamyces sp. JEL0829]